MPNHHASLALAACGLLLLAGCADRQAADQGKADKVAEPAARDEAAAQKGDAPKPPAVPGAAKADDGPVYQGTTVAGWIARLQEGSAEARANAARALGQLRHQIDPDDLPVDRVVPALTQALADGDKMVRFAAAEALAGYGKRAVPAFVGALKHKDARVRKSAADGLGRLAEQHYGQAKGGAPALGEALLTDPDEGVRGAAAFALWRIGQPAVPALVEAARSKDVEIRKVAVRALGRVQPPARAAVHALVEALKAEDDTLRYEAATALGQLGDAAGEGIPALLTASKADDSAGKAALEAIGRVRKAPRSAAPALIALLKDDEPRVRLKAVEVLVELEAGEKECLPALLELVKRRNSQVRRDAAQLLSKYGSAAKEAVPSLVEAVRTDTDASTRSAAITTLLAVGPPAWQAAVPALAEVVRSDPVGQSVGSAAARALGVIGPDAKAAVPALKAALSLCQEQVAAPKANTMAAHQLRQMEETVRAALKKIEP